LDIGKEITRQSGLDYNIIVKTLGSNLARDGKLKQTINHEPSTMNP
jgi:hypothetical protein